MRVLVWHIEVFYNGEHNLWKLYYQGLEIYLYKTIMYEILMQHECCDKLIHSFIHTYNTTYSYYWSGKPITASNKVTLVASGCEYNIKDNEYVVCVCVKFNARLKI